MIINHKVEKSKEGTYYVIPFEVPQNILKITLSYEYNTLFGVNAIDFGLQNEKGELIGWSGNDRRSVYVGVDGSSDGFLSGDIQGGTWGIIVGAYRLNASGVDVKYTVDFEQAEEKWYFGDLHAHTTASDGVFDAYTLASRAKEMGLDFLCLTNHNNYSENLNLPKVNGITLIPGVEWTHYKGHVNFFGIDKPFDRSFIANSEEEAEKILAYARQSGALVSVNHPTCPYCPYLWDTDGFEYMEIWNGPMRKAEVNAIQLWESKLKKGKRVVAVGGSDYHRPSPIIHLGTPMTAIYAKTRRPCDLLEALAMGKVYVTNGIRGAKLEMIIDGVTFGGTVCRKHGLKAQIAARDMKPNELLLVKSDKGVIGTYRPRRGKVNVEVDISQLKYVYVMVMGFSPLVKGRVPTAVSNPVYIEK